MRKLIVAEFVSLDGVMQAPGGVDEDTDGGFKQGGWTLPYWHDDIGAHFFQAMSECDTLLLGRKTWQGHAVFETLEEGDPFGDLMKAKQKYVVSTTLQSASAWRNSTIIRQNVVEEVRKAGERAALLTRQLLIFSRRQVAVPQRLDLNALLADMREMVRRLNLRVN